MHINSEVVIALVIKGTVFHVQSSVTLFADLLSREMLGSLPTYNCENKLV